MLRRIWCVINHVMVYFLFIPIVVLTAFTYILFDYNMIIYYMDYIEQLGD